MALGHGPTVVTNGLVLALDAADRNSFDSYENLLLYSEDFSNAYWSKSNVSITSNAITSPTGSSNASKLVESASTQVHELFRSDGVLGVGSDTYITFSIFAKAAERQYCYIRSAGNSKRIAVVVDLSNGTFNVTNWGFTLNSSATVTPYPNGWYRITATSQSNYPAAPGWVGQFIVSPIDSYQLAENVGGGGYSYAGNGTSGIYIWGAHYEFGPGISNYYATTGTAKTRGTTLTDLTGRGNTGALTYGPTYNSSNGGAIVFDGSNDCVVVNSNASVLSNTAYTKAVWFYITSFATNNNLISGGNNGRHAFSVSSSNKLQAGHNSTWDTISSTTSLSLNTWYHAAVTFSTTTGWRLYLNGALDSTNSSTSTAFSAYDVADALFAEVPYGVGYGATTTFLGSGEILIGGYGTGSNVFNGRISNASVYNRVLSATEIQQNYNALRGRYGI